MSKRNDFINWESHKQLKDQSYITTFEKLFFSKVQLLTILVTMLTFTCSMLLKESIVDVIHFFSGDVLTKKLLLSLLTLLTIFIIISIIVPNLTIQKGRVDSITK